MDRKHTSIADCEAAGDHTQKRYSVEPCPYCHGRKGHTSTMRAPRGGTAPSGRRRDGLEDLRGFLKGPRS